MKLLPGFLLIFFSLIFTGCFDILEDIAVNKDGSGNYKLTFDMDDIINDPFMKGMLLEAVKNEGNVDVGELDKIVIDSTIYFREDPQFAKYKDNKVLWETAKMHLMVNEEKGKMFINFGFDFNSVEDIATFFKSFSESGDAQKCLPDLTKLLVEVPLFSRKKT